MDTTVDNKNNDGVRPVSVGALISRCEESAKIMSQRNPNRNLLMNCAWAMRQLVDRLDAAEDKLAATAEVH